MATEETKVRSTPRDFFLHLGVIVTLYLSVGSLITLLFQIINYALPDPLSSINYNYYDPYSGSVRWAIAMLIITFPIFWLISWVLNRDYIKEPLRKTVAVRRWLVYLTLFVAGLSMMIDLVVLVNTFLGGEISARFILKVLAVLIVAGLVFGYYIYDLRKYPQGPSKMLRPFLTLAALIILISIVSGFAVMGSPGTQRKLQFDVARMQSLQSLDSQIITFWQRTEALPAGLSDLSNQMDGYYLPTDPETGAQFQYKKTGPLTFELCADFDLPSSALTNKNQPVIAYPMPGALNVAADHAAGHTCFPGTIDPTMYKPLNPTGVSAGTAVSNKTVVKGSAAADYSPTSTPVAQ